MSPRSRGTERQGGGEWGRERAFRCGDGAAKGAAPRAPGQAGGVGGRGGARGGGVCLGVAGCGGGGGGGGAAHPGVLREGPGKGAGPAVQLGRGPKGWEVSGCLEVAVKGRD